MKLATKSVGGIFRYSTWDAVPAALTLLQFVLVLAFCWAWPSLSWTQRIGFTLVYAFGVGWNLNSVAHNFIHNPFFARERANTAISYLISWTLLSPQTMYRHIHMRHHAGNADRPGPDGSTIDPLSIYQYGDEGKPEPLLSYVFVQFFRDDDPFALARKIAVRRPDLARQAMREFWSMVALWALMLVLHWPFVLLMIVGSYLGQCLSNLAGYYEHLGANPDKPIAWGVSTYEPLYNWMFMNNGYHAEHHYRPKMHWTLMRALHRDIAEKQAEEGVFVIRPAHWLGFFDPRTWSIRSASRPRAVAERKP
jgi:fatty acid desaturase